MAKDKKSTSASFVDEVVKLLDKLSNPIPKDATPFEIAQHAAARIKMAETPDSTTIRDVVKDAVDSLIEERTKQFKVLD